MNRSLDILRETTKNVLKGGSEKSVKKHTSAGKLLARDRINLLVDKQTAFLELSPLAAHDMYEGNIHAAGIITGIGSIHGYDYCTYIVALRFWSSNNFQATMCDYCE